MRTLVQVMERAMRMGTSAMGAAEQPATPMDVDTAAPEGEPSENETGEEWWAASETLADSAAAQAAAMLVGLVAYGASSDDGSGEEEEVEEGGQTKAKDFGREKEGGKKMATPTMRGGGRRGG